MRYRSLNGSLGDSDDFGQYGVTDGDRFAARSVSLPIELQVNEKSYRRPAMCNQVTHQCVQNVWIDSHLQH